MTTKEKFDFVMQSGSAFSIFNRPVKRKYYWDIKICWRLMKYNGKDIAFESPERYDNLEDCLDDMIIFLDDKWKDEIEDDDFPGLDDSLVEKMPDYKRKTNNI